MRKAYGFTIVELLIVIVVIAILASLSYVAYTNIQQRAHNTAIIDAAGKTARLLQTYISTTGSYPAVSATILNACVTVGSGCYNSNNEIPANTTFSNNIASVGAMPRSVPVSGGDRYGIHTSYYAQYTVSGQSQPLTIVYWLQGLGQQCGLSGVTSDWPASIPSAVGYTASESAANKTLCRISVPGPQHSI